MTKIISKKAIQKRKNWVDKIAKIKGAFASNSLIIEEELEKEISKQGINSLLDHLRLCGNIPESYGHDTTEEKQYSKYTDAILSFSYRALGIKSIVITERADVADVEGFAQKYSFVADAKAFRLSRTAKNQKDFKVQAMERWKHGKPYAMVVCPMYQLPSRNSQIYLQAATNNVCILTYAHLALLVQYAEKTSKKKAENLLFQIFKTIPALLPSKNAGTYWLAINRTILEYDNQIEKLWHTEKLASSESLEIAKLEALKHLANEREKIMRLSHNEALKELIKLCKIDNKITTIQKISGSELLDIN